MSLKTNDAVASILGTSRPKLMGSLKFSCEAQKSCSLGQHSPRPNLRFPMPLEPIAIIGIGCRFPGGANNPDSFWQLLKQGIDAITEIPGDRWNADQFYDPDPTTCGKINSRWGGFLEKIDQFDAQFFGIAPREAITMDPQQRLLMEVAWESLEDAGIIPDRLRGSKTGVFIGIGTHDYSIRLWQYPLNDPYSTTGTGNCIAANRISYWFDFKGPSLSVDTACSSALVSVHLACQSLWAGESSMALAGGVNAVLLPTVMVGFGKGGFLSGEGRCKSFDASADGYVRSEGAGVVVLKPLSQAEAEGDPIYAVIRATAVNQDGWSNGIAAPNPRAQEAVLREAYAKAGISPGQVQYIEAHGTGTKLGDPVELEALGNVLREGRATGDRCRIGSVKTNIGHCETAAGIAGLIKTALALKHRQIPPSLHFRQPNPTIPFEQLPLEVQQTLTPWTATDAPPIAGVNSFGFGGTNAHAVLQGVQPKPEAPPNPKSKIQNPKSYPLLLSAKTDAALRQLAEQYRSLLQSNPNLSLAELCRAASTRRSYFSHRLALIADSPESLMRDLAVIAAGEEVETAIRGVVGKEDSPAMVFLFTGQGSQYPNMGRQLYDSEPVFRAAIDRCAEILDPLLEIPLLDLLYPASREKAASQSPNPLDQTAYTQPALFALEYALAQLWLSWDVRPAAVLGHSVGEYVAACVAGVFSLEDGLKLIAERGRLMQSLPAEGAMVAVFADGVWVAEAIQEWADEVAIAAFNSPQNTVISGTKEAIADLTLLFNAEGIKTQPLTVSHAFHSPLMEPILAKFGAIAAGISFQPPQIPLVSNLTGTWATGAIATPDYWVQHIRQPVRFTDSLQTLHTSGYHHFLECGAKPTLLTLLRTSPAPPNPKSKIQNPKSLLPSLHPSQPDTLQRSLATLYTLGFPVNWEAVYVAVPQRWISLPAYPFQRQRFWWEPSPALLAMVAPQKAIAPTPAVDAAAHPLLGQKLALAGTTEIRFQSSLSATTPAYLQDHRVGQAVVLPGAAYAEMLLAAAATLWGRGSLHLTHLQIEQALVLQEAQPSIVQTVLKPEGETAYQVELFSQPNPQADFTRHATGQITRSDRPTPPPLHLDYLRAHLTPYPGAIAQYYQQLQQQGLSYGAAFQGIRALWQGQGEALAQIQLPPELSTHVYHLHPALLDAGFQAIAAALPPSLTASYLPIGIQRLALYQSGQAAAWCYLRLYPNLNGQATSLLKADLWFLSDNGAIAAQVEGLSLKSVHPQTLQTHFSPSLPPSPSPASPLPFSLPQLHWLPLPLSLPSPHPPRHWLILSDTLGFGQSIAQALQNQGDRCTLLSPPAPNVAEVELPDLSHFDGILHLWSLESPDNPTPEALQAAQKLGCGTVLQLVQALQRSHLFRLPHLWVITQRTQAVLSSEAIAPTHAPLWALGRVLHLEYPALPCTLVDLAHSEAGAVASLLTELNATDGEPQIAYRRGDRHVARLVERGRSPQAAAHQPETPMRLQLQEFGVLDHLTLAPMTRRPPQPGEVEIQVAASGVNFRDVLNALGLLKPVLAEMGITEATEVPFGGECAGTVVAVGNGVTGLQVGDRVLAAQAIGSLRQFVTVDARFVAPLPASLSWAEAATLPTTFLTAYYGLCHLAGLKLKKQGGDRKRQSKSKKLRVLIHSAAGGVGLAAVQLAQLAGAEIFATASPGKWDYLQSIGVDHVMNSRTLEFANEIPKLTQGKGVDLILNSLNGDFIPKSLEVLAPGGSFVEIGKIGIWDTAQVHQLRADVNYLPFDLLAVSQHQPALIAELLAELMQRFQVGDLKPLPKTVFPIAEAASAFRYMAQAKHIGKVVVTLPAPRPTPTLRDDSTCLITGGLGALGLSLAEWLVQQGVRHLLLVGRSAPSATAQAQIRAMESTGATVTIHTADITQESEVATLLAPWLSSPSSPPPKIQNPTSKIQNPSSLPSSPPLRGIFHCAGVLADGLLRNQTWQQFERVMAPKILGAWHLHRLTQTLPLDYFVCFSSIAALLGSPGQGNYAAANGFLDALAHHRQQLGLPGLSLNWGPWAVGMAARLSPAEQQRFAASGLGLIQPEQGWAMFKDLLNQDIAQVGVMDVDWSRFLAQQPAAIAPFFEQLQPAPSSQPTPPPAEASPAPQSSPSSPTSAFLQALETQPPGDRLSHLQQHLQDLLAKVLGFQSGDRIDPQDNFADLGMDSLMAVEFNNRLQSSLGCTLGQGTIFDYPTIAALSAYLLEHQLQLGSPAEAVSNQTTAIQAAKAEQVKDVQNRNQNGTLQNPTFKTVIPPSPPASPSPPSPRPTVPPEHHQFPRYPKYLTLRQDLDRLKDQGGNPFFGVHQGVIRDTTQVAGRTLISYASYNYVGMSGDPVVMAAAQAAIAQYGTSVSASRVVAGERPIHRELEQEIAAFLGTEDCIVYIGGHATNVTTIGHLFGDRDLILCDALSHNSIREGCKLSGATVMEFAHNQWQDLERLLQHHRHQYEKVLIAIEGIYSTDGDVAPLPEIVALKHQYQTFLLVDEAHSIGVLGATGRGIGEHFGIAPTDVDLWMGTLSKSFASCGGYIAGCRELVEYLKYTAPGFVFSVGMSPPNTAAALAALRLLQQEPERVAQLRDRAQLFLQLAQSAGLNTGDSHDSPIIPVIVGEPAKAIALSQHLFHQGLNVQPMIYPSVPFNAARLRFFLTCLHSEAQIHETIEIVAKAVEEIC